MIFETAPSQTVGPYFAIGLPFDAGPYVVPVLESVPARRHTVPTDDGYRFDIHLQGAGETVFFAI